MHISIYPGTVAAITAFIFIQLTHLPYALASILRTPYIHFFKTIIALLGEDMVHFPLISFFSAVKCTDSAPGEYKELDHMSKGKLQTVVRRLRHVHTEIDPVISTFVDAASGWDVLGSRPIQSTTDVYKYF